MTYEVGDRLYWFESISISGENEPGPDAPERYATVTAVDDDGTLHVRYDDGLEDWMDPENISDFFERVTWDTLGNRD